MVVTAGWYQLGTPTSPNTVTVLKFDTRETTLNIERSMHSATAHVARLFAYDHLPPCLQAVSKPFHDLAEHLINAHSDGPELTVALRHLKDAKDAAVNHAVLTDEDATSHAAVEAVAQTQRDDGQV